MPRFQTPHGDEIVAVLETTPCIAGITSISEDGIEVEYDGAGSKMLWDSQKPVTRNGTRIFLDDSGGEWTFDQLTVIEGDADEP